jgi:nucleoside-diphosphate-sugar epimerase
MGYKIILTGATGMVGKGVLLECMDAPEIEQVLLVSRKTAGINHAKVREILVQDFFDLSAIEEEFKGYDACFFCLGITSIGETEASYRRITYDLSLNFARSFIKYNENSIFCYVSGTGTDSTEKGKIMWARIKGKTENALLKMPFKKAYMFRPGYIQPLKGIKSKTKWVQAMYTLFWPVYSILKHFPGTATNTTNMGLAMINSLTADYPKQVLGNKEINKLALK